ncbi:hypothetical protein IAG44_19185 [Streptomyces roseirectus]|uniref:Uncharacterized protein n=1 Tax=Streptomyces roseirectus TaxID=2768066 RepID=A0A7H0IEY1_9ACTN|nr:hypothetical protein [Streptomyces roseirectus]QNP71347.1 hypothetical protein IAG44_19185 [Streptomyces roseirectus]
MKRRGRTALLISTAACLGVLSGVCTGYLVQAERSPTPLPPLSQAAVPQAKGSSPEPLSAALDRRVKTDGDLRKLLVSRPKGGKALPQGSWRGEATWMSLAAYSATFAEPSSVFNTAVEDGFRRAVTTNWLEGERRLVRVSLIQYNQSGDVAGAAESASNGQYWAEDEADTRDWSLPGTGYQGGTVYVHDSPDNKDGYLPLYSAEAHAWRGDLYVQIYVYDTKPISKSAIMGLAQRQMGKL